MIKSKFILILYILFLGFFFSDSFCQASEKSQNEGFVSSINNQRLNDSPENLKQEKEEIFNNDDIDSFKVIDNRASPILNFIARKITPFIEKRIDYYILKNGFNSHLQNVLNLSSGIKFKIIKESSKENAKVLKCGQMGNFNIIMKNGYDSTINNDFEKESINLIVGVSDLKSSFDLGVLDMKEGEERIIKIRKIEPNSMNIKQKIGRETNEQKEENYFHVKYNYLFGSERDLKIDDFYKTKAGGGIKTYNILKNFSPEVHCGSFVNLTFKILDVNGVTLYDSENQKGIKENFLFKIGSGQMPIVIDWALTNMHYEDQKIIFIKSEELADLLKFTKNEDLKKILNNPGKDIILEINPKLKI